jgi:uncharacterized membrane protein
MNPDSIQDFLGTLLITVTWLGAAAFVYMYARYFRWRSTTPGRTLMIAKLSMLLLTTYLVAGRWLAFDEETRGWVSLAVFFPLAVSQVLLAIAVYLTHKEKISLTDPNFTPFRDWLQRRRDRRANRKV